MLAWGREGETRHRLAVDALGATHALLGCPWMNGDKHEIGGELANVVARAREARGRGKRRTSPERREGPSAVGGAFLCTSGVSESGPRVAGEARM